MKRRDLIVAMGAGIAWPSLALAQRSKPLVGYLSSATSGGFAHFVTAFHQGLTEAGYREGREITIQYKWAEGRNDRLPALATELVDAHVAVIAATGGFQPAVAAKAATSTIPIVFTGGGDPVQFGLVASLARPGGNATGAINFSPELTKKRLELLRELVGNKGTIGVLSNAAAPNAEMQVKDVKDAADAIGQPIKVVDARSSNGDFSRDFDELVHAGVAALFVIGDPVFTSRRAQLVTLAAQHSLPASYAFRDFALAGGLMSYGADLLEVHRQAGVYTGRILKGSKPADLPVLRPTKFNFVINVKTAKALGIGIPDKLIALANEVIE